MQGQGYQCCRPQSAVELLGGTRATKPFLMPRGKFKICLYCKINPVDATDFDAPSKMTFPMKLTLRDRKDSNLQSGNLQLWAMFILLTHINFRVEFQCPTFGESLETS